MPEERFETIAKLLREIYHLEATASDDAIRVVRPRNAGEDPWELRIYKSNGRWKVCLELEADYDTMTGIRLGLDDTLASISYVIDSITRQR